MMNEADLVPRAASYSCPAVRRDGQDARTDATLSPTLVVDVAGLRELRPAWEALHIATGGTNPFTQWSWMWHWWQIYGRAQGARRDRLHIVVLRQADVVRAIVPLILTTWGRPPLAMRKLRLYGFIPGANVVEMAAPLIWPGWEAAAA